MGLSCTSVTTDFSSFTKYTCSFSSFWGATSQFKTDASSRLSAEAFESWLGFESRCSTFSLKTRCWLCWGGLNSRRPNKLDSWTLCVKGSTWVSKRPRSLSWLSSIFGTKIGSSRSACDKAIWDLASLGLKEMPSFCLKSEGLAVMKVHLCWFKFIWFQIECIRNKKKRYSVLKRWSECWMPWSFSVDKKINQNSKISGLNSSQLNYLFFDWFATILTLNNIN